MFDKFGKFNSAAELNEAAAKIKEEGDQKRLLELAEENGISNDDADDYINGYVDELVTPLSAALGRLMVEKKDLELQGVLRDWYDAVVECCINDKDLAAAVMGKDLVNMMAQLLAKSFNSKVQVSSKIVDITMVNHNGKQEKMRGPVYLGIPSRVEVKNFVRAYYLGGNDDSN